MNTYHTLASLFEHVPHRWSLRGNPCLWSEMQARLAHCAFPATEEALMSLLEQTYRQLTGMPLTSSQRIFVEPYSCGGISTGYVSR